ncbi:MAG TPA: choice-of-anchor Q domain-containing protein [Vicinamibacterales bacterium]|nr:choice-of-anchor Q domain-containing protein [Vicinamibacterales bacterium]
MRRIFVSVAFALASCNAWQNIQCEQSSNCDLSAGGECLAAPTGNMWCAYPDPSCSGGYRYSDQAVGDGLGGVCVPVGSGSGSGSDFACGSDADCAGMSGTPFCAASGACVACLDDSECTSADAPVCDGSANVCRGCEQDSECASGICLESNGTCADADNAIYVSEGGSDAGNCTSMSPCKTLAYAFDYMNAGRNVIRIIGGTFDVPGTQDVLVTGFIDGANTHIIGGGSDGILNIAGDLTVSGVILQPTVGGYPAVVVSSGRLILDVVESDADIYVNGGELDVYRSKMEDVDCGEYGSGGSFLIDQSELYAVEANDCNITLERSTLDVTPVAGNPSPLYVANSMFVIENDVFVSAEGFADGPDVNASGSSVFRFNTLVNLSGEDQTANPFDCSGSVDASNNVIAWHTSAAPRCPTTFTLYDSIEALPPGEGNQIGSASTFFVDMANKNFHLAPGSPAIGAAESSACAAVPSDHDGSARPGSACDVGAYESP